MGTEPVDYCREIETYLCRKNDGHLIRVVGPSFELVTAWAVDGVPLKVAFTGIDRCFERYYRKGPRRRPVKIDFCEADVLDAFDEWRRALGLTSHAAAGGELERTATTSRSLPAHLERAAVRLTNARAQGTLGAAADRLIDSVSAELDAARAASSGVRGEARQALLARLEELDCELLAQARAALPAAAAQAVEREADAELSGYRGTMAPASYERARQAAIGRLIRHHFNLPTLSF